MRVENKERQETKSAVLYELSALCGSVVVVSAFCFSLSVKTIQRAILLKYMTMGRFTKSDKQPQGDFVRIDKLRNELLPSPK